MATPRPQVLPMVAVIQTIETAVVDKPAEEDEHAGHHHGHAH
jgi:hypothetical protein